jgi:hypothetical protein
MIDVTVIHFKKATTPSWYKACIDSIKKGVSLGYCNLYTTETTSDSIGEDRFTSLQNGKCSYVTYIDSDDLLIAEALPELENALDKNPNVCGVYSDHLYMKEKTSNIFLKINNNKWNAKRHYEGDYPRHIAVYRREAIMPYIKTIRSFKVYSEYLLSSLVTKEGPWLYVPSSAYIRRERSYYVNRRRPIPNEIISAARKITYPILINHF